MKQIKTELEDRILKTIYSLYPQLVDKVKGDFVEISVPKEFSFGDFSTSVSLKLSKIVKQSPMIIAQAVVKSLGKAEELGVSKVEIKSPGFINFFVNTEIIISQVNSLLVKPQEFGKMKIDVATLEKFLNKQTNNIKLDHSKSSIRLLFEFADPNPFKEFHIGHLRNITLGESYCRLLENLGIEVVRVNYQGDVGSHVAKAIWGIKKLAKKNLDVKDLAKAYVIGSEAYEKDDNAKKEILAINLAIYNHDSSVESDWHEGRKISLDAFEKIYKRVGTVYKRYFFESEIAKNGVGIVKSHIEDGIFEKSEGAVIYKGEKDGLHTRVFITKEGYATYEAKDLALAIIKYNEYKYDVSIIITGHEQAEYFKVMLAALSHIRLDLREKTLHMTFGMVNLKGEKMTSRKGNVITGNWLLDEAKKKALELITKENYTPEEKEDISEKVALGAVKYSMLKFSPKSDILFNFDESVSLDGDCGPYIMYTFARTQSVLRKIKRSRDLPRGKAGQEIKITMQNSKFNEEELNLLRLIYKYIEVCFEAGLNFAPNVMTRYLFDLAQAYNLFYNKHQILNVQDSEKEFRLALNSAVGEIIKKGLYLLGIDTVSKM